MAIYGTGHLLGKAFQEKLVGIILIPLLGAWAAFVLVARRDGSRLGLYFAAAMFSFLFVDRLASSFGIYAYRSADAPDDRRRLLGRILMIIQILTGLGLGLVWLQVPAI